MAGNEECGRVKRVTLRDIAAEAQVSLATVDRVLNGRLPTAEDAGRLVYTRQVLEEAMRLYPAVPINGRLVVEDAEVDGHQILGAHPAYQPIRHLSQQGIADMVIHAVVDRLEVVEIQHH